MKKRNILIASVFLIVSITSCNSTSTLKIENFYGKRFDHYNGNIKIEKKTDDYSCIYFDDAIINVYDKLNFDDYNIKILDQPKIIHKNNKNYLSAEGIESERFEFISNESILDLKTNIEYKLNTTTIDLKQEIQGYLGKEYYTKEMDSYIKIIKKTETYSFIDIKIPKKYFNNDENIIASGRYDSPRISASENTDIKFLIADKLEEDRFMFIDNDSKILDIKTRAIYSLKSDLAKK